MQDTSAVTAFPLDRARRSQDVGDVANGSSSLLALASIAVGLALGVKLGRATAAYFANGAPPAGTHYGPGYGETLMNEGRSPLPPPKEPDDGLYAKPLFV